MKAWKALVCAFRWEMLLFVRGRIGWILAVGMLVSGVGEGISIRLLPIQFWTDVSISVLLTTLLITLAIGEIAQQGNEYQGAKLIWSTPIGTTSYLWGKYLCLLTIALGFSLEQGTVAILTDWIFVWHWPPLMYGHVAFQSLGIAAYIDLWWKYMLWPMLLGTSLAYSLITILKGQQIIVYLAVIILWITSYNQVLPGWLDVLGMSFHEKSAGSLAVALDKVLGPAEQTNLILTTKPMETAMNLVRMNILMEGASSGFLANRGELLLVSLLLVWITVGVVGWRRQRYV